MPSTPRARSWLMLLVTGVTVAGLAACGGDSRNDRPRALISALGRSGQA